MSFVPDVRRSTPARDRASIPAMREVRAHDDLEAILAQVNTDEDAISPIKGCPFASPHGSANRDTWRETE